MACQQRWRKHLGCTLGTVAAWHQSLAADVLRPVSAGRLRQKGFVVFDDETCRI